MQLPYEEVVPQLDCTFWEMIGRSLSLLWKEWPKNMKLSQFHNAGFVLSGDCPHCYARAAFPSVKEPYSEQTGDEWMAAAVCRCQACSQFILGIVKTDYLGHGQSQWKYYEHYPLGTPDDTVSSDIPPEIRPDFQEALRCRFVKAYNATAEMCRRALEASCVQQGAPADVVLSKMIDWLHDQRKITTPLRDMAHKIKLGGNLGAHPSDKRLTEEDADAVLAFTDEYFQHVYVTPARMAKHDFSKSKKKP